MKNIQILKGDILYAASPGAMTSCRNGFLVIEDGLVKGVYKALPTQYENVSVTDYKSALIVPGMTDLHLHASQYVFRGMWMDEELLDWLNRHTFPIEARYRDKAFADEAYRIFRDDLVKCPTTRAVMFATLHREATLHLMDLMEDSGLVTYVGKVNMDRNAPDILREESATASLEDTVRWLSETEGRHSHTRPILTPRFVPSCTDDLLDGLGRMASERGLPVQSHLSENFGEIDWVKDLCPWSEHYGEVYDRYGLFGSAGNSVMAHCVHSGDEEIALMKARGTFIAHCPDSNVNLASGIAPAKRYLSEGLHIGLGSDVAGGSRLSLFAVMREAVQVSKLRWRLMDETRRWLSFAEVFYMATKGGGAFFGRVGSFEEGYEADVLVLDDTVLPTPLRDEISPEERMERIVYQGHNNCIVHKYVQGRKLF
ncbi:MAG: amidohydrolase family protein [Lachnospiraceae bacterium]|nr:amidohydrolase family protein [Lachnospiraceae bacterium]